MERLESRVSREEADRVVFFPGRLSSTQRLFLQGKSEVALKTLSQTELHANGLVRIERRRATQCIDKRQADIMQCVCREVLSDPRNTGYIQAADLTKLEQAQDLRGVVTSDEVSEIRKKIDAWKKFGYPPIFNRDLYSETKFDGERKIFPAFEFYILFCGKRLEAHMKAPGKKKGTGYEDITNHDMEAFLSTAFTEDGIDPQLKADVIAHIKRAWEFQNDETESFVYSRTREILDFLETTLRPFAKNTQKEYENPPLSGFPILKDSYWYLSYSPKEREKIVRSFLDEPVMPGTSGQQIYEHLQNLFPGLVTQIIPDENFLMYRELRKKEKLARDIEDIQNPSDLSKLSTVIEDELAKNPDSRIAELIINTVSRQDRDAILTLNRYNLARKIGISFQPGKPWLTSALDEGRIKWMSTLTDEAFTALQETFKKKKTNYGEVVNRYIRHRQLEVESVQH